MRRALPLMPVVLLLGMQAPDDRRRLTEARRAAAAAAATAAALTTAAKREIVAARGARQQEHALAGRVEAAAATVRAAQTRVALIAALQDRQRARLAAAQEPVARLLAALTGLARRPTIAAIAQPGSIDDLIHVRAMLGATLPAVRARTVEVRTALAATRRLADAAALATRALADGRADLDRQRAALIALEARHRGQAVALSRDAADQSERAMAMGERARDLVDRLEQQDAAVATVAGLADLPGPTLPQTAGTAVPRDAAAAAYRLPVQGRIVVGLGELSLAGVRSRGLSFAVLPAARVTAPAGGTIRYAARFRGYGVIVLIDHGGGWSSLVTGLGSTDVRPGMTVAAGVRIGRAAVTDEPRVTVELRRRGRPVDIAALL